MTSTNRQILSIALPAIVANITTPLLALVDVAIVGHIGNALYIGAIAVGGSVFNMVYWLLGFLRAGTSGLTAQHYGAGHEDNTSIVLQRALLVSLALGIVVLVLQWPLAYAVVDFMTDDDMTAGLARKYFFTAIWGAPAVLGTFAITGWLLGMQNARATMAVSVTINVVNVVASLVLVFALKMDITGVALGSLIAQWVGFVTALCIAFIGYRHVRRPWRDIVEWTALRRFFVLNFEIFLRTVCMVAVLMWFTRAGAMSGPVILACNAILMQMFMLFSYFADGFAYAGEALAGRYYGAGDSAMLGSVVKALMRWGLYIALATMVIYYLIGEWFLSLLTTDAAVLQSSHEYMWWVISVPLCGVMAFVWDGVFIGLTRTRDMLYTILVASAVYFGLFFGLYPVLGNHGLWAAFIAFLLIRGLLQWAIYHRRPSLASHKCR